MLRSARDAGIDIWLCLHHFTLPGWFSEDIGGFLDDKGLSYYWPRHVDFMAETFGDLVVGWKPVNEPMAYAALGWLLGTFPPGRRDAEAFGAALEAAHLANHEAWRQLRSGDQPVATVHNLSPLFPADDRPETRAALRIVDDVYWNCWVRAMTEGVLQVPGRGPIENEELVHAFDLVGFSYYGARQVGPDFSQTAYPPGERTNPLGDVPWSEGLRLVLERLAEELPGRDLLVCEHGVGTDDDDWREEVLKGSLRHVEEAVDGDIPLKGFFHWTAVDNYEWTFGYEVPFGLFDRDRNPRPASSALLKRYATGS